MPPEASNRLVCGTDPARLLTMVADHAPPADRSHEAGCPYCQAALAEFRALWEPVQAWAKRPTEVPADLVRKIVQRVRRLVQSPRHLVTVTARGATTVTSWVLGLIAADATRNTDGVIAITGASQRAQRRNRRSTAARYGADGVDIIEAGERAIDVSLSLHAGPVDLPDLVNRVRYNIRTAIAEATTLDADEIDITIDDITLPPPPQDQP